MTDGRVILLLLICLPKEFFFKKNWVYSNEIYLSLYFCCREELRRWFIQQEMDLFRYRFIQLSDPLAKDFLEYATLAYDVVSAMYLNFMPLFFIPEFTKAYVIL